MRKGVGLITCFPHGLSTTSGSVDMRNLKTWAAAAALIALSGASRAELFDRGNGLIYDSTFDITWLADMNYAKTSGVDSDGLMDWATAKAWAEGLSYGGFSDWRLPTLNAADSSCSDSNAGYSYGYNCMGGQLSHLFVVDLGNAAGESVLGQSGDSELQKANLALFSNVSSDIYWSGVQYARFPDTAWASYANLGRQDATYQIFELRTVAVRSGDAAAVPEPRSYTMLLAGLAAVATLLKRRSR